MSCWLIYLVLTFVNYFREQQQRQQIRSAFGFYLSPQLVEQLARSPEKLVLGGEERRMTILFSDVAASPPFRSATRMIRRASRG